MYFQVKYFKKTTTITLSNILILNDHRKEKKAA